MKKQEKHGVAGWKGLLAAKGESISEHMSKISRNYHKKLGHKLKKKK